MIYHIVQENMDSSELTITSTSPKHFYITITLEMYYYHMHMLQYNPFTTFLYIWTGFINVYFHWYMLSTKNKTGEWVHMSPASVSANARYCGIIYMYHQMFQNYYYMYGTRWWITEDKTQKKIKNPKWIINEYYLLIIC